jgi:hypothetical protein
MKGNTYVSTNSNNHSYSCLMCVSSMLNDDWCCLATREKRGKKKKNPITQSFPCFSWNQFCNTIIDCSWTKNWRLWKEMFYIKIEKQKKIVDNAIHITILNSLATFHGTEYRTKTISSLITGFLVHGEHSGYVPWCFRQTTVKFRVFLIATSFFKKRPSSSCLVLPLFQNKSYNLENPWT